MLTGTIQIHWQKVTLNSLLLSLQMRWEGDLLLLLKQQRIRRSLPWHLQVPQAQVQSVESDDTQLALLNAEDGDFSALGNISIGMTYKIHEMNGLVFSSNATYKLNSSDRDEKTG